MQHVTLAVREINGRHYVAASFASGNTYVCNVGFKTHWDALNQGLAAFDTGLDPRVWELVSEVTVISPRQRAAERDCE
jgi:hypothetical protein